MVLFSFVGLRIFNKMATKLCLRKERNLEMQRSKFYKWAHEKGYLQENRDHNYPRVFAVMSGGNIFMPQSAYTQAVSHVAADIMSNAYAHTLIEQGTHVFQFYLDLDFKAGGPVRMETMIKLMQILMRTIRCWYDTTTTTEEVFEREMSVIVLRGQPNEGEERDGYHVHVCNLYLDAERALNIRTDFVHEIMTAAETDVDVKELFPDLQTAYDIVDEAVYAGLSLRVPGCDKIAKCQCQRGGGGDGSNNAGCSNCLGSGLINVGRRYFCHAVITESGGRDKDTEVDLQSDMELLILSCSIRCADGVEMTAGYRHRPLAASVALPSKKGGARKRTAAGTSKAADGEPLTRDDTRWEAITTLVRTSAMACGDNKYSALEVTHICYRPPKRNRGLTEGVGGTYKVKVDGRGSRWCQNVGRDHRNSPVFFIVTQRGIIQKCFSKKLRGVIGFSLPGMPCMYSSCRNFQSKIRDYPQNFRAVLFGCSSASGAGGGAGAGGCGSNHQAAPIQRVTMSKADIEVFEATGSRLKYSRAILEAML